jgi:ribonucleoside-triphosphate reductase
MPRLGILSVDERDFFHRLGALMDLSRDSLETKRKMLEGFTDRRLYPYSSFYLRGVKQRHGSYWANHFSTIGLVGMNEACQNLLGVDIGNETGWEFAMRVLGFMRDRLQQFQRESGHFYNLEATPAEGTAYRLARLDREHFPDAMFANGRRPLEEGEEPFYTNSTHLPVNYTGDIFEVLDHQENLQTQYTGGTVVHVYVGEAIRESATVKAFVRKVCTNYRLPYFTLTPTFSVCPKHGYLPGEQPTCPKCNGETEVYSRVVGYLRPVQQWNGGKQEEFGMRHTFVMEETAAKV